PNARRGRRPRRPRPRVRPYEKQWGNGNREFLMPESVARGIREWGALPQGAALAGHHAQDRPAWCGVPPAAGPPPLRGGAVTGLAGGLPAAAGALRAARRPPAWVPAPGLCVDVPEGSQPIGGMKVAAPPCSAAASRHTGADMAYQVPAGRFVGRTQELARLGQLLAGAVGGQPLLALLGGGGGGGEAARGE